MNKSRRTLANEVRKEAADLAANRVHPQHIANEDEQKYRTVVGGKNVPSYLMTFTKGLEHDKKSGLVKDPEQVKLFIKAIDSGDPRDFIDTKLFSGKWQAGGLASAVGANVRAWESQGA